MAGQNLKVKEDFVGKLNQEFAKVNSAIISHYSGTTVEQMTELRSKLREQGVELKVIKNTLAKIAVKNTGLEPLTAHFKGPTAIAFSDSDPVALAKILKDFSKINQKFQIQAGVLDGQLLEQAQVNELADLPSREVLLGRLVGALQSPIAGFVCVNSGILRKAVYALDAVRREKEKQQG